MINNLRKDRHDFDSNDHIFTEEDTTNGLPDDHLRFGWKKPKCQKICELYAASDSTQNISTQYKCKNCNVFLQVSTTAYSFLAVFFSCIL